MSVVVRVLGMVLKSLGKRLELKIGKELGPI